MDALEPAVHAIRHAEAYCFYCLTVLPVSILFSLEVFMEMFICWAAEPVTFWKWARPRSSNKTWPLGSTLGLLHPFFVSFSLFLK